VIRQKIGAIPIYGEPREMVLGSITLSILKGVVLEWLDNFKAK
jgi:hypothetical protein